MSAPSEMFTKRFPQWPTLTSREKFQVLAAWQRRHQQQQNLMHFGVHPKPPKTVRAPRPKRPATVCTRTPKRSPEALERRKEARRSYMAQQRAKAKQHPPEGYLSVKELQAKYHLGSTALREYAQLGLVATVRLGGRVYLHEAQVLEVREANLKKRHSQIAHAQKKRWVKEVPCRTS